MILNIIIRKVSVILRTGVSGLFGKVQINVFICFYFNQISETDTGWITAR